MSHETPRFKTEPRQRTGSRYAQRLRREGKLPAVVYGHHQTPIHLAIDGSELVSHLHDGGHLLEVEHDGTVETCLIKDVQYDYLGTNIVHVDLARVDLNEEIEVSVPIVLKGKDASPGAKAAGAIVEMHIVDIEIVCTAGNIPDEIVADITGLELDQHLTVGQLKFPEGSRAGRDAEDIVLTVGVSKPTEESAEAAAEVTAAEPEVIKERKVEGEAAAPAPKKK